MKELTFEQACEQVAKKHGYYDWKDLTSNGVAYTSALSYWNKEAAELYASQYREEVERLKANNTDLALDNQELANEVESLRKEVEDAKDILKHYDTGEDSRISKFLSSRGKD